MILYRLFIIVGGAVVIALFTALIAPYFVDWSNYKLAFEREASRIAGQPVTVDGAASMRLLPLPTITFTDVSVGRHGDDTPMMTVDAFSVDAELMPFLRGQVRIVDMRLIRPRLVVRVNENGTIDWTARRELVVGPENVKIENLQVEDASIRLEGLAGGRVLSAEGLSATVSARSLHGPWRIDARGLVEGRTSDIVVSTGRLQESGSIRLRVAFERDGFDYRMAMDGPLALRDGILTWEGEFELDPKPGSVEAGKALPILATGQYTATPNVVDIGEYRLEIGDRDDPYTITGTAETSIREEVFFRATADGRQIDFDRLETGPDDGAGTGDKPAGSLADRIAVLTNIIQRIPVPEAKGEVDFLLPAIVAGDTVIRDFKARVRPDGDGWRVASLSALFPGDSTLQAIGRLSVGEDFGFDGNLLVASRQPTGLANWLTGDSSAALRQLRSAGIEAKATLRQDAVRLDDMEISLDGVSLSGRLERLSERGGRPQLLAELSGERIDVDQLAALYTLAGGSNETGLAGHNLDLTLNAGLLEGQGMVANDVESRLRFEDGAVSIVALNAGDFYGATIHSSGRLADLLGEPSGNLVLDVTAQDGARLARLAHERLGENRLLRAFGSDPRLSGALDLRLEIEARPVDGGSRGTVALEGAVGGTRLKVNNRFAGSPRHWRAMENDLSFALEQQSPLMLARQLALPVLPFDAAGPVSLSGNFDGNLAEGALLNLAANAPQTDLSADGVVRAASDPLSVVPEFDLAVTLGSQDLEPWLFMAGYPLPGGGTGAPASLNGQFVAKDGTVSGEAIFGQYDGTAFSGSLALNTSALPRSKLSGEMAFDVVSARFLGELVSGAGTFSEGGAANEFGQPLVDGVDAKIGLTADRLELDAGAPASSLSAQLVFGEGAISLTDVRADWLGGQLGGMAELKNAGEGALARLQLRLTGANAASLLALTGHENVTGGKVSLALTADGSGRSARALADGMSGTGVLDIEGGHIGGIRTGGLFDLLAETDAEEFTISPETVQPIADRAFLGGMFEAGTLSLPVTLGNGRFTVRNIAANDAGGMVRAEASYRLVDGYTEIRASIDPDPRKEALAGAEPSLTFVFEGQAGQMNRSLDTTALEGFLSLRAYEREQRRVEILQASVLQNQRLRREVIASNARIAFRERRRDERALQLDLLQTRFEEEVNRVDLDQRLRADAAERQRQRIAEERARREAEEKARREAEAAARRAAEEAERRAAEEAARLAEEAERKAAEEAALLAEEQARLQREAEEEARVQREAEEAERRQRVAREAARLAAERGEPSNSGIATVPSEEPDDRPIDLFRNLNRLFGTGGDR